MLFYRLSRNGDYDRLYHGLTYRLLYHDRLNRYRVYNIYRIGNDVNRMYLVVMPYVWRRHDDRPHVMVVMMPDWRRRRHDKGSCRTVMPDRRRCYRSCRMMMSARRGRWSSDSYLHSS